MIKAVIFDVGGVLLRTEDRAPRTELEQRLGLAPGTIEAEVINGERGHAAQRGEGTLAELWAWAGERYGLDADRTAQMQRDYWGGDRLHAALVDYIRTLRPRYQTAIISNAFDDLTALLEQHAIADAFDLIVGSAYEGMMKPNAKIYERTLSRLGRAPAEAIFIDDAMPNIEGARTIGMHVIHYTPDVDVPAELAKLGVSPESDS